MVVAGAQTNICTTEEPARGSQHLTAGWRPGIVLEKSSEIFGDETTSELVQDETSSEITQMKLVYLRE